ncbi:MAG: DUF929 family protein [Acidimicrobiales bacterium]|nr:DUF929 family protein [Acidimicrobiales bacterium]
MSEAVPQGDQPERKPTSVPPRSGKAGKRPAPARPAQRQKASQLRQARARRNRIWAGASVGLIIVVVAILIVVATTGSSSGGGTPRQPAPAAAVQHITSVPLDTLVAATHQVSNLSGAGVLTGAPLTSTTGGAAKPEILYIGAEFCPICAAQRWPLVVALSQFGTFTNLQKTHSAVRDGNIQTLSFYGSTYNSPYFVFTPVENTTNQPSGNFYKILENPTAEQNNLWSTIEAQFGQQQSYPFINIGGKYALITSQYPSTILSGKSWDSIASSIGDNTNTVGASINASAAVLVKYICSMTNQQPANVCQAVSSVTLPAAAVQPQASKAGG